MDPTPRPLLVRAAASRIFAPALAWSLAVANGAAAAQEDVPLGDRVDALVRQLDDPASFERATSELTGLGDDGVPFLVGYLDPEGAPYVSADIAVVLGRMGERGAGAIGALLDAYDAARSPVVRQRVLWAIGEVGPWAGDRRGVLQRLASRQGPRGGSFSVRVVVARLTLGPSPSREDLEEAFAGEADTRMAAARVLALGHPAGAEFLPELVEMLPGAARGSKAPVAPPFVGELQVAFAEAVVAVAPGSEQALEASAYLLRHHDPHVRALAMARISAKAPSEVAWLSWWDQALRDPSPRVVREALAGSDRHGDLSLLLVPRLRALTESPHREIRWMACPRLDAVLEQLSPLGRQMYELTTCPQRELREREEKLARDLLDSQGDAAVAAVQAMPQFFARYLGNDEVADSARRVLAHMHRLAGK